MQFENPIQVPSPLPQSLCSILPDRIRRVLDTYGKEPIEEIRFHADRYTTLQVGGKTKTTSLLLGQKELGELLYRMCGGSLYAYADSINQGFVALGNDVRVGVCGKATLENRRVIGVRGISGLVVRLPHSISVDTTPLTDKLFLGGRAQSTLIYAPPGVGKTTLLRALTKEASSKRRGFHTVVVDCREEFSSSLLGIDLDVDCLCGYPKALGIEIAVRSLGANLIVCDEIGSADEAEAILTAGNCGVPILCSAHAKSLDELLRRPPIAALHRAQVFDLYVGLERKDGRFFYRVDRRDAILDAHRKET